MARTASAPRRVDVHAFLWTAGIMASGLAVAAALITGGRTAPILAAVGVAVAAAWCWRVPTAGERVYLGWIDLDRRFSRWSGLAVTGVCFCIVAAAGGRRDRFRLSAPAAGTSGWSARAVARQAGSETPSDTSASDTGHGWIRELTVWCRSSGNVWVFALLPYLLALTVLGSRGSRSFGKAIYTLY